MVAFSMKKDYQISRFLRLISGVLLFLALGYRPYFYYTILRWVVMGTSLYSGWVFSKLKMSNWAWTFFIISILFNPIIPVYLNKSIWQLIDLLVGGVIMFSLSIKHKQNNQI